MTVIQTGGEEGQEMLIRKLTDVAVPEASTEIADVSLSHR